MSHSHNARILNRRTFADEPFSKREAWSWLLQHASNELSIGQVTVTLSYLASRWQWHKSKVNRFIKLLKDETMIETISKARQTVIIISNFQPSDAQGEQIETISKQSRIIFDIQEPVETMAKQAKPKEIPDLAVSLVSDVETKSNLLHVINLLQRQCETIAKLVEALAFPDETAPHQNDVATRVKRRRNKQELTKKKKNEKRTKKEKNQKKEKREKEEKEERKSSLLERAKKKEKMMSAAIDQEAISNLVKDFGLERSRVEWELAKFTDYYESIGSKSIKNPAAAFRNWLRRAVEFNFNGGQNDRISNAEPYEPSDYERFLAAGARVIAKRARRGLDGRDDREDFIFLAGSTENCEGLTDIRPVN